MGILQLDCWAEACDVLYTDLMSPMHPDDNTHSLMLLPQQSVPVLMLVTFDAGYNTSSCTALPAQMSVMLQNDMTDDNPEAVNANYLALADPYTG